VLVTRPVKPVKQLVGSSRQRATSGNECKYSWSHVTSRWANWMGRWLIKNMIFTSRTGAKRLPAGIVFTLGWFFGFSPPQRQHVTSIKVKLAGRSGAIVRSSLPNFTLVGSGVWVYGPKTLKIWNFANIIAHKGRIPYAILTKFTAFMCALGIHNSAKFGCFISINDRIINNLPLWGHFQPNIWWPLVAKLLIGSKNVKRVECWHGGPLSLCKKIGGNRTTHISVRGKCMIFFTFFVNHAEPVNGAGDVVALFKRR